MEVSYACTCYDFVIEAVFMGILCVFGFAGNTVSTVVLSRDKSKTATPFLLVSLEVADTLFLVTVFALRVLTSIQTFGVQVPGLHSAIPYLGKYIYPCALLTETGTIYLTILVTLNRYISVCHPYKATNLCSVHFARRHVGLVCLFSVVFNLPRFFEYEITDDPKEPMRQTWLYENRVYKIVYRNLFYFVVMFLVPLISLTFLNRMLIKALRKTKKRRARLLKQPPLETSNHSMTGTGSGANSRSEDDITFMLIVVVMVFVVTQTPAMVTQVLGSSLSQHSITCPSAFFFYERLSDLLVVANSSLNFIIYCFCSRRFREILIELVCVRHSLTPLRSSAGVTTVHPVPLNVQKTLATTSPHAADNEISNI